MSNLKDKVCTCGHTIKAGEGISIGIQSTEGSLPYDLDLFNCPKCNTTLSERRSKNGTTKKIHRRQEDLFDKVIRQRGWID